MESLLFEMISVGFVMLSIALITGSSTSNMFAQHLVHKTVLSIVAWIAFAVLLWSATASAGAACNDSLDTDRFAVLMLAYFGSKAVIELILTADRSPDQPRCGTVFRDRVRETPAILFQLVLARRRRPPADRPVVTGFSRAI